MPLRITRAVTHDIALELLRSRAPGRAEREAEMRRDGFPARTTSAGVLAVLLLAAELAVPVCPHAGGVGLCEYVQHLSIFDYIAVGASLEDRVCEYVDHLHEHFVDPCRVAGGRYLTPERPGYSIEMRPESPAAHAFPGGAVWRAGRT